MDCKSPCSEQFYILPPALNVHNTRSVYICLALLLPYQHYTKNVNGISPERRVLGSTTVRISPNEKHLILMAGVQLGAEDGSLCVLMRREDLEA